MNEPGPLSDAIRERFHLDHSDGLVLLGSGWRDAWRSLGEETGQLDLRDLPGAFATVVPGHDTTLRAMKTRSGAALLVAGSRTHLYEGHGAPATLALVRAAAALGARSLIQTNGAGSTRAGMAPGTVVVVSDHINLTGTSPLGGAHFVDLTDAYSARLRLALHARVPDLVEGVYAQFRGPQYETPAEVRMARLLGADLVGMSTAMETIGARALGLEVLALSLVTNLGAGVGGAPLDHAEVTRTGPAAGDRISRVLTSVGEML
jgi:purine-nucleoside phosphorylase